MTSRHLAGHPVGQVAGCLVGCLAGHPMGCPAGVRWCVWLGSWVHEHIIVRASGRQPGSAGWTAGPRRQPPGSVSRRPAPPAQQQRQSR